MFTADDLSSDSYTVILASDGGAPTLSLQVRRSWVKAGALLGFVFVVFGCTAFVDYLSLSARVREHAQLLSENLALKDKRLVMEKTLSSLSRNLVQVHNLTTKLRIITRLGDAAEPSAETLERGPAGVLPPFSGGTVDNYEESAAEALPGRAAEVAPTVNQSFPASTLADRVESALQESQLREQELMNTWGALSDRQSLLLAMPSIKPAGGYYSSPFGYRYDPINGRPLLHAGLDIAAPWGTQVLAPADGVVSFAGYEGGYGNLVAIDHGYGVTTRFGHNSKLFVHQGQRVHRWEVISLVGSTGHSTGSHVHYEVRVHGLPVDPMNYILQEN